LLSFAPPCLLFTSPRLEIAWHVEPGVIDDATVALDGQKAPVVVDGIHSLPLPPAGRDVTDDDAVGVIVGIIVYPGARIRDLELASFCLQALAYEVVLYNCYPFTLSDLWAGHL
jgi:hypothetical protein